MSLIEQYKSLKDNGTIIDRLKYLRTIADPTAIFNSLNQSTFNYDDTVLSIVHALATKNQQILLDLFNQVELPVQLRIKAAEGWLKLEKDEKSVHQFIINTLEEKSMPRLIKYRVLKLLHSTGRGKRFSTTFYYNLALALTKSMDHEQFNIDAHTLPYCSSDAQIMDLLTRWSISRLNQLDPSLPLRARLIRYQPLVIIQLIKTELITKYNSIDQLQEYFRTNRTLFISLAKREPKAMCRLAIEHLNRLEKHRRVLPAFVENVQKRLLDKAPDEMIELLLLAAQNQPGVIKYEMQWGNDSWDLAPLHFPSSFTVDHYVQLFWGLYDTCNWTSNHLIAALQLMLRRERKGLHAVRKRSVWFNDIIVQQKIGKDIFMKKLFKQADQDCLDTLDGFSDICAPLARHLLAQLDRKGPVSEGEKLDFLRYELMTTEIFDKLLSTFKSISSNVNERSRNYPLIFRCAVTTGFESVTQVFQWLTKRFTNEQLPVLENFLRSLGEYDDRFHLTILPKNLDSLEQIMNVTCGHLQYTTNTIQIIFNYLLLVFQRAEYCRNGDDQRKLRDFTSRMIKKCVSIDHNISFSNCHLNRGMPTACNLLADILISDVFPKLISKTNIVAIQEIIVQVFPNYSYPERIDTYLEAFFFDELPKSTKLQTEFKIDQYSELIKTLLNRKSTRLSRAQRLVNEISELFLIDNYVQEVLVRSGQHRALIDRLVQRNKTITVEDLTNEENPVTTRIAPSIKDFKMPGLSLETLNTSINQLTDNQQVHVTKILLDDYLINNEVRNTYKLKALRVLRRLSHTYDMTVEWIHKRHGSSESSLSTKTSRVHCIRGADAQSIDDILICLPASSDLSPGALIKEFELLKVQINASNAKFVSQAMLSISRKVPDQIFLKSYLDFVGSEQFSKLGITVNKEVLRLLINYRRESSLVNTLIYPLWSSRPHQDVRTCLIHTILHFFDKAGKDESSPIWSILEQAASDEYMPVIQSLYPEAYGQSKWILTRVANTDIELFRKFVEQIQCRVLDHPQKLEARRHAWSYIDHEHCDPMPILEKAKVLCHQFDKEANACWKVAFEKVVACCKQIKSSSSILVDLIQLVMSRRDEIDQNQNAIDAQHDLPVYHRVHQILTSLILHIEELRRDHVETVRQIATMTLKFDLTLASFVGQLLIGLATNKEDLYEVLTCLEKSLPNSYAERIIDQLGSQLSSDAKFSPFINHLNCDEKLALVQWFVQEKHQESFVFRLFTEKVLGDASVDREQCQNLLRQFRQSTNFYVRENALQYTVPWNEDGSMVATADDDMADDDEAMSASNDSNMS